MAAHRSENKIRDIGDGFPAVQKSTIKKLQPAASIFEKSRMSRMMASSAWPGPRQVGDQPGLTRIERGGGDKQAIPITPLSGVRISWLIVKRNCDLAALAAETSSRARIESCWICSRRAISYGGETVSSRRPAQGDDAESDKANAHRDKADHQRRSLSRNRSNRKSGCQHGMGNQGLCGGIVHARDGKAHDGRRQRGPQDPVVVEAAFSLARIAKAR